MTVDIAASQTTGLLVGGLNANWIESLLRRENKTVDDVWQSTFAGEFANFLQHDSTAGRDQQQPELSSFDRYVLEDLARTAEDVKAVHVDLRAFSEYCNHVRSEKWLERWRRPASGDEQSGRRGLANMPPLPAASPFNSAALFLELFFLRLQTPLKTDLLARIKKLLSSADDIHGVDPIKKNKLLSLAVAEGTGNSFDLIPLNPSGIRTVKTLRAEDCGQLVVLRGVVTRCSDVKPELRIGAFECQACGKIIDSVTQHFRLTEPTCCWQQPCGNRTQWNIKLEYCIFNDWQKLRVQQAGEENDAQQAGSVPRAIDVIARNVATEKCKPGDRINATGVLIAVPDVPSLLSTRDLPKQLNAERNRTLQSEGGITEASITGLRKLGVRDLAYRQLFLALDIQPLAGEDDSAGPSNDGVLSSRASMGGGTAEGNSAVSRVLRDLIGRPSPPESVPSPDHQEFWTLLKHPILRTFDLSYAEHKKFRAIANSISCLDRLIPQMAPEVFGCSDVKKGLLLLLIGGVEKVTRRDNIKLRGDINICIVGDPGTAKSQLLKFVQTFAERAVLASGKSSTAAGLTASVHKDLEQGESVVEAGALILADMGVCCIDEFDKMDVKDMVAIHEAMEQQTISISKAGIQATMNARASVLAACSPADGRYNVGRPLRENLKMSPTIMSRFDLIFVILDKANEEEDRRIAAHILEKEEINDGGMDDVMGLMSEGQQGCLIRGLKIDSVAELRKYCRIAKCFKPRLTIEAREILSREYVFLRQKDAMPGSGRASRMTVRQLESMIRISEAIAKVAFSDLITAHHANLAVKLFTSSCSRVKPEQVILDDVMEDDEMMTAGRDSQNEAGTGGTDDVIRLDADVFERIQGLLVDHLRDLEDKLYIAQTAQRQNTSSSGPSDSSMLTKTRLAMSKAQVVEWYMAHYSQELVSDEDLVYERHRLFKILTRMEVNGVIIAENESLGDDEGYKNHSSGWLRVHPNFGGGRYVRQAGLAPTQHQSLGADTAFLTQDSVSGLSVGSATGATGGATSTLSSALNINDDEFVSYLYGEGTSQIYSPDD